jgi:hypothetical protein
MLQLMQSDNAPVASETGFLNRRWRVIVFHLEKRSLERKLETVLRAAAGHESNQMPAGAHEYQLLRDEADSLTRAFAARWDLDTDSLRAKIPGLSKLEGLSTPRATMNYAKLTYFGVVAIPLVCFLMGTVAGLVSLGFHLVGGR